ncbi:cytochrome b N-terminal domain-containing protein, partial [Thermodesulfobacteriota bacterium]
MEPVGQEVNRNHTGSLIELLALDGIISGFQRLEAPVDAISWHRFFGALNLVLLVLLFATGSVMAFYYSPVPGTAYDSVDYALYSLPFGDVIKGVHHYSWNLLLVVMGLHLLRAFVVGAYKAPRQLVWVSGVILLVVLPMFIITGDLLPWDQKGYWSTRVRLSIIGSVPFVGDFIVRIIQGGPMTGIVALNRFYVMHTLILPCVLVLLISSHFHFIAHRGLSGPLFNGSNSVKRVPFLPHMVNRWLMLFILVAVVLGIIARIWTAPLGDPADPTDSSYIPKPEWWVLFLNQLVAIFRGSLS